MIPRKDVAMIPLKEGMNDSSKAGQPSMEQSITLGEDGRIVAGRYMKTSGSREVLILVEVLRLSR